MNLPPQLIIFLVGAAPLSELRGAIPLGLAVYKMSPLSVFFWAVLGNIVPVVFLLWLLNPVSGYLSRKSHFLNVFFQKLFNQTRRKHSRSFEVWGALALVIFVATPLPLTGGWSGAAAAYVFGIPFRKALPLISLGIAIAGVIVLLTSIGVLKLF